MENRNNSKLFKLSKKDWAKKQAFSQIGVFTSDNTKFPIVIPSSTENVTIPKKRILKKCAPDMEMDYWEYDESSEDHDEDDEENEVKDSKKETKDEDNSQDIFIAKKILFCSDLLRMIDSNLTPKCALFTNGADLLHGFDLLENFTKWREIYNFNTQTIFNNKINNEGIVETANGAKQLRGLGASAVFFSIVGIYDRSATNWGLIEKTDHYQVVNLDLDDVLWEAEFEDRIYAKPTDIIKEVFENLCDDMEENSPHKEFPLPSQLYDSDYLKMEIYETVMDLHKRETDILKMLKHYIPEDKFQRYNKILSKIIIGKINSLHKQFANDPEYMAVSYINSCFEELGYAFRLSQFDKMSRDYFLSIYNFVTPFANEGRDFFIKTVKNIFEPIQQNTDTSNQPPTKGTMF